MMKLPFLLSKELEATVDGLLEEFERRMMEELKKLAPPSFMEPMSYAVHGGKRVRPLILLLASRLTGEPSVDPFPAAMAIELLHCESLIHDDIIDREGARRGKEPFYLKYGAELSLLSADLVLGISMNLISRYRKGRLMRAMARELSRSVVEMCEGELLEASLLREGKRGWNSYLKVVRLKTAPLFRASAKLGGLIATEGREAPLVRALSRYGLLLGMAYQVRDDILDAERGEDTALKLSRVKDLSVLSGLSKSLASAAKEALKELGPSPFKEALSQLADVIVERRA